MRAALDRLTAPLFAWIPDISRVPLRRQVVIGVLASILLHLLAFLIMGLLASIVRKPDEISAAQPQPQELELEIVQPEESPILPAPVEPEKQFIDSRGLAESKPAERPLFETDKDMTAASEQPATGDVPLPSHEGKGRIANVFETKKSAVGAVTEPPAIELAAAPPVPAVTPSQAQPAPTAAPAQPKFAPAAAATPTPVATPPPKTSDKPDAALAKAELEKLREVVKRREDEIALAAKEKLPPLPPPVTRMEKPVPEPTVLPAIPVRPTPEQLAKLTTPSPLLKSPSKSGYQPELEKSRVEGRITNRGRNAVDAVATPLGRYKTQVYNAIGARWLYYVKSQMDVLAIGSAKVSFYVTRSGRVQAIRVDGNTANASFAEVCERAIRDAEIASPPAGSLDELRDGRLEYSITFTLYSLHE